MNFVETDELYEIDHGYNKKHNHKIYQAVDRPALRLVRVIDVISGMGHDWMELKDENGQTMKKDNPGERWGDVKEKKPYTFRGVPVTAEKLRNR